MMPWGLIGILFALSALLCSIGFYKFTYFLSVGDGFAIAGGGIAIFIMYLILGSQTPLWIVLIGCILFLAYGVRLSGFLLKREWKEITFKNSDVAKNSLDKKNEKKMPIFVTVTIWLVVAALYVCQVSPVLFRFVNGSTDFVLPVIGFAVAVIGLVIETMADLQKTRQKKKRSDMVATEGLYKICRCPNYFGEIIFWTGVFLSSVTTLTGFFQWLFAGLAYVSIVYIMINGAQRLEKRQNKRYGAMQEYRDYVSKTPILLPLLPIYTLEKKKEEKKP